MAPRKLACAALLLAFTLLAAPCARALDIDDDDEGTVDLGDVDPDTVLPQAHKPRNPSIKKPMDPTFSSYLLAVTASSILESWDYSKGEKLDKTQIDKFYQDVGEVYAMECGRNGLPPPVKVDNLPPRPELESGAYFNAYSMAQFTVAYRFVRSDKERAKMISRIGQRLLEMITQYIGVIPSGWVEDVRTLKSHGDKVIAKFVELGFAEKGGIKWAKDYKATWKEGRKATMELWWQGLATDESSRRLFKEYGNAQFYPAVTLMAYFNGFAVYMDPLGNNDPNQFPEGARTVETYAIEGL